MKKSAEHTFVIMAHKESPYLKECIDSLKAQTAESEILISTSTPSPLLSELSESYSIPLIINNSGNGIASDWSFAFRSCTSRYITLVHQDDIYMPEYTAACLAGARRNTDSLISFTDYSELSGKKTINMSTNLIIKKMLLSAFLFKESVNSPYLKRGIVSFGNPIPCPSVMYNREHIGDFEFSEEFCCNMDWDAWLRLSERNGSFVYVKKVLMAHRIHKDSQTSLQVEKNVRRREDDRIFERLWPLPFARVLAALYSYAARGSYAKQP